MKVTPEVIANAVMRIFRNDLVTRSGGRLSIGSLEEEWKKTRLRSGDLADGIALLEREGCLRIEQDASGRYPTLTEAGAHRISDLPHAGWDWLRKLYEVFDLGYADRRRPSAPGSPHNRRAGDAVP